MTIGEGKEPFVLAKEAYEASKKNLTSGTGDGILEIYSEKPEESELHLDKKARCKVYFQGDKFHIRLNFEKHNKDIGVSRIIICDGKTILSSFVCQRVRPLGVKADMYEVDKGYDRN